MASIRNTGTLRAGIKARQAQGFDSALSKVVELNCKYRLFFRITKPGDVIGVEDGEPIIADMSDIIACTVPGRSLDLKAIGYTYIPFGEGQVEVDDSGKFTDISGLASYARIAKVLHDAQCTREKKLAEDEAHKAAEALGQQIDTVSLARTLEGIELKYHGGKAADGTPIMAKIQPVISRLQQKITTQVLVVKLDASNSPDWDNAQYAVFEVSNQRATELFTLLDNPDYCRPEGGYLEVGYDYVGKDKQAAGKAAKFQGIASSLSLETQYPELWEKVGRGKVDNIVHGDTVDETAALMKSRNQSVARTVSPNDVVVSFRKYCSTNAAVFASIDFESDSTKWATNDFLESKLLDNYPKIKERFEALKAELDKEKGKSEEATQETPETVATVETDEEHDESVLRSMQAVNDVGAQTLKELTSAVGNLDALNDGLGGDIAEL